MLDLIYLSRGENWRSSGKVDSPTGVMDGLNDGRNGRFKLTVSIENWPSKTPKSERFSKVGGPKSESGPSKDEKWAVQNPKVDRPKTKSGRSKKTERGLSKKTESGPSQKTQSGPSDKRSYKYFLGFMYSATNHVFDCKESTHIKFFSKFGFLTV